MFLIIALASHISIVLSAFGLIHREDARFDMPDTLTVIFIKEPPKNVLGFVDGLLREALGTTEKLIVPHYRRTFFRFNDPSKPQHNFLAGLLRVGKTRFTGS
jgi:hypothetical protein